MCFLRIFAAHQPVVVIHGVSYLSWLLQENGCSLSAGHLARGFPVLLLHDLADCCQVGDIVEVTGMVVLQLQSSLGSGAICLSQSQGTHQSATLLMWRCCCSSNVVGLKCLPVPCIV
jgi:hypothetical protein